jgi:type VI secretion system protein ImpK
MRNSAGYPARPAPGYAYLERVDASSLLAQLREFHAELVRIKIALASGTWVGATGDGEENPDIVLRVQYRLRRILDRQAVEAARQGGGYGAGLYREAQYVMAALADEVLLHLVEWEGRRRWRDHLLEMALFQSQIAGERIFDQLDQMLSGGALAQADLAAVYLVVLSLGFRGKYRGIDDNGALRDYRMRLRALIRRSDPAPDDPSLPLFSDAYAYTIRHGTPARLPHTRPWLLAVAALLLIYLGVQHVLWNRISAPVAELSQRVYAYDY